MGWRNPAEINEKPQKTAVVSSSDREERYEGATFDHTRVWFENESNFMEIPLFFQPCGVGIRPHRLISSWCFKSTQRPSRCFSVVEYREDPACFES